MISPLELILSQMCLIQSHKPPSLKVCLIFLLIYIWISQMSYFPEVSKLKAFYVGLSFLLQSVGFTNLARIPLFILREFYEII